MYYVYTLTTIFIINYSPLMTKMNYRVILTDL